MNYVSKMQVAAVKPKVSEAEWNARVDLAAAYQLSDLYGLSDMIYTHISARVPDAPDRFLINSNGLLFGEITASNLITVDMDGNILLQPVDNYGLHPAGFTIHSGIYRARPDVCGIIHTHTIAGMAVSALKCGLLPLTQTATRFYGGVSYHDFNGPERDPGEREKLAEHLGQNEVMILRNHGLLTTGQTIQEAFTRMYGLERACQAQLAAMACNTPLNILSDDVVERATSIYKPPNSRRYGLLEWPALLRLLDQRGSNYRD